MTKRRSATMAQVRELEEKIQNYALESDLLQGTIRELQDKISSMETRFVDAMKAYEIENRKLQEDVLKMVRILPGSRQ